MNGREVSIRTNKAHGSHHVLGVKRDRSRGCYKNSDSRDEKLTKEWGNKFQETSPKGREEETQGN